MRRRTRRLVVAAAAVAVALAAARIALDPLAAWRTRRTLAALRDMHGTVGDVEVHLASLTCVLRNLRIEKVIEGRRVPYVDVERATLRFRGRELLRGRVISTLDLDAPKLHVLQRRRATPPPEPGKPQQVEAAPRRGSGLERLAPLGIDRAQVRDGEILLADARDPKTPVLRLHRIELAMENLGGRVPLRADQPTVVTGSGTLQRTGRISLFATADPLAAKPTFAGRARLVGLRFEELRDLVATRSDVVPSGGVLEMAVQFGAVEGRISGEVRPILNGGTARADGSGIVTRLKAALADGSLDLFREDVDGGADAAATTIPFAGTVKNPRAHPVPTIVGVLRNAFVVGLSAAFHGPPSRAANDRTREQARKGARDGAAARRRDEATGAGARR